MIGSAPIASLPIGAGFGASVLEAIETSIIKQLMGRLRDLSLGLSVAWPNVTTQPPAATYLKTDVLWNRNANRGIADSSATEHRGIFQVTVVAAAGSGIEAPTNIAGAIASHFERGSIALSNGLRVQIEGKPSLGPTPQAADRIRIPVSIRFYAFV